MKATSKPDHTGKRFGPYIVIRPALGQPGQYLVECVKCKTRTIKGYGTLKSCEHRSYQTCRSCASVPVTVRETGLGVVWDGTRYSSTEMGLLAQRFYTGRQL